MKKWIWVVVLVVFVVGSSLAIFIGLGNKESDGTAADVESSQTTETSNEETKFPYVSAKQKLTLIQSDLGVNLNAEIVNANADIEYLSLDTNIAEVNSLGNVFAIKEGTTKIKSFAVVDGVEYSYTTNVVVYPKEFKSVLVLQDKYENEVKEIELWEKYTLKLTTSINLDEYEISFVSLFDKVKSSGVFEKKENTFCCEIYFIENAIHTFQFKLILNADNEQKTYLTDAMTIDNHSPEQDSNQTQDDPEDQDTIEDDQEGVTEDDQEDITIDDQEDTKTEDGSMDEGDNTETKGESGQDEGEQIAPTTPKQDDQETPSLAFCLDEGTNKNVEISGLTIRITNYTKNPDIAISIKLTNTNQKYTIRLETLSGDNVTLSLSTSMLGISISSTGTTSFRLYTLEDPTLSQTFTIIVE